MPSVAAGGVAWTGVASGPVQRLFPRRLAQKAIPVVSEMNMCPAALEHLVHMGASCSHAIDEQMIAMIESGGGRDLARLGLMEKRRRAERMNARIRQALVPFDAGALSARIADTSASAVYQQGPE